MTQEELTPFAKYINANAKVQGMVDGTQKKIDKNVQERVMEWSYKGELNGEKQSGENMVYVTDDKGRVLVVASGDVAFDAEGKPKEDVGDMLVVYDTATGEVDFVSAKDVKFHSTESAEDYGKRYTQHLQELNSQAYVEAAQAQQQGGGNVPQQQGGTGEKPQEPATEGNNIGGEIKIGNEKVLLSDEIDDNGKQFVLTNEGNLSFGEVEKESGLPSAPILLSEGMITNPSTKDGYGLVHIEARHGDQIRKAGYKSVLDFIENVAKNYEVIKEGNKRNGHQTYRLQLTDKHNNTLMIELSSDGSYWNINTAGIFKTSYGKKNKEVYNRHTTEKQSAETAGTSQSAEQSDTQAPSRMNVPTSSLSKDSNSSSESGENKQTLTFSDGSPIPMTTDSKGRQTGDLTKMSPEHGAEYLEMTLGEMTDEFVEGKIKAAEKAVDKAKKTKVDMSGDIADVQEAIAKKNEEIAKVEAELNMYTNIKKARAKKQLGEGADDILGSGGTDVTGRYDKEREQGYRIGEGNVRYDRQREEEQTGEYGKDATVAFSPDVNVKGKVKVVEADSVQASHTNGQLNPYHFGHDWQPKDRTSADSSMGANKIASNIDPEQITGDGNAFIGSAPSVNKRHEVIQGNNRTEALKRMYAGFPEQAAKYKQWLIDHAEEFGLNAEEIAKMKNPIMVNELPVDDAKAKQLGQYVASDFETGDKRIPLESVVINKLGNRRMENFANILLSQGDLGEDAKLSDLIMQNAGRVLEYLQKEGVISNTEANTLGKDKVALRHWLDGMLRAGLFGGDKQTEAAFNKLPENAKKAVLATYLRDVKSGEDARIKQNLQRSFEAYSDLMNNPDFANAKNLKEARAAVAAEIEHGNKSMFGEEPIRDRYSTFELELAALYKGLKDQKTLTGLFGKYFDAVQGDKATNRQLELGEEPREPISKEEAIKEVFSSYDTIPAETQKQVNEAVKGVAVEISKQVGEDLVVTDEGEAEKRIAENETTIDGSKLRFQIKTPEQRKAAENAYDWAQQHRPSEHTTYAVVDMSRPDSIPQYFEKKDLAKHFKKYWSVISNGEYKLINLDKTFEENVKNFTDVVPDEFNPSGMKYHKESDEDVLARLDSEPKVKVYRAMQIMDGKLYPPMAAAVNGKRVEANELGVWIRSDENPDLAIPDIDPKTGNQKVDPKTGELKWKFKLDKGGKDATGKKATNVNAAYNPYWHTSRSPLNDQFKSAWIRPNIVIVECEVPESELTSGYKAERAKDAVGEVDWKSGSVSGEIYKQTGRARKVILSRWCKPIRVLSEAEFAQKAKEYIGDADVEIPENVVTPKQRIELEKLGVKIGSPEKGVNKSEQIAEALEKGLSVDNSLKETSPETVAPLSKENVGTSVVSGDAAAKVQKNLDATKEIYRKSPNKTKGFITDVSKALGLKQHEASQYGTFETSDGKRFTIRISNHNTRATTFDENGEHEGISIVISRGRNKGIRDKENTNAHVVEYFYSKKDIETADGKPLADIIESLKDTVVTGEYKDKTGLAKRDEVNGYKRFFRTKDGEVYGFTDGKKIYLDTKRMKPDTPLHEYTHLWGAALRRTNEKEWENVKGLLDKVDGLKEEIQKTYPELKGDDLYDEMLAMFSGREGTKKLEDVCRKLAAEEGKRVTDSAKEQGFIDKVKTALQKFWKATADLLHVHFTTAEDVADKVLADWARGYDPREKSEEKSEEKGKGTVQERRDTLTKKISDSKPNTKKEAWGMVVEAKKLVAEYFGLPYEEESVRRSNSLTIAEIKGIAHDILSKIKDETVEPATEKQMDYLNKLLSEENYGIQAWGKEKAALDGIALNKRQASWLIDRIKEANDTLGNTHPDQIAEDEKRMHDAIDLMRKQHGQEAFDWDDKKPADPVKNIEKAAEQFKEEQRERNGQQKEKTPEEKAAAKLKEQQKHPLTNDEIDTYTTGDAESDEMAKEYAKDYLDGDRNPMAEFYYNEIYNNVRNRQQDGESDSNSTDTPHMDGGIDEAGESGRDRGTAGRVDGETSGDDVPEGKPSSESRESGTPVPNGEGGNKSVGEETSTVEGLSTRSRGRRGGSKSGGAGVAGTRPKSASENKASTGSDKQSAKAAFEESGKEISDIFAKLKKLREANRKNDQGKLNAYPGLASAVVGELAKKMLPRSKEEFSLYSQLMKACIKHAYNGLRLFGEKAETWFNGMRESLHDAVKDVYGDVLNDEDVDNFIKSMWDTKYTIDGKRQTIGQWASEIGHEKLREALRKPLEQKRKEQQAAEKVEVKVGDAENIAETLPFLLPAQQEDVLKAEKQFFAPSHADDAHGGGRGMMFTNGTGTGKTYTGLGIAKRFIKQGKGRVLIVTPSPAKVNDWSNDAKNLGITLTPLKGETGKGATMQKGEGAVVTTFANFRQNRALMEDTFDLVIYDESHKLMENKDATESATTLAHYRMTNKDFTSAMERLQLSHPLWKEAEQLEKEKSSLIKGYYDADAASMDPSIPEENVNRAREIEARLKEIDKEKERVLPELTQKAREAVGKTKVVFLSATPFNMRENIEYAEGYLFKYPTPKRPENISEKEWAAMKQEGKNTFFRQWFPNGERIGQNGKIEPFVSDADKSDAEERNFADHLMNLGVMSGRTIDNGYDYSRDFPMVSVTHANTFNTAVRELSLNPQLRAACSAIFNNYNVMSVVYETMKVAAAADRIKQHLGMGRKVVIFHRRVNDRMGLARPPFEAVLERAELAAQGLAKSGGDGKMEAQRIRDEIAKFKEKYKGLLNWEQTLDYRMPREQLASLLGDTHDYTPEEMQARNNAQTQLIDPLFNGRSNMDPYEAGREFAKSCFDFEDADIVEQYKPHQVTEEEAEETGERVTSAAQHKKDMAEWRAIAKEVRRGVEDVIRERVKSGELKIELDEKGNKKRKVGLFAGADSKNQKIADMDSFNKDDSGMDVIVVQEASGKEGISLHDITGVHQRVMINLALPQSPIAFIQAEGRIYRIGQKSNAIFEYPLLGIDNEISLFAGRFNTRAATTENLALGNMARGLKNAIMRGVLAKRGKVPLEGQGYGGRDWDMRDDQRATGYDAAVEDWKNEHEDNQTGTIDEIDTPQPLGFKLVDWAQMSEGEKTLEPSAGAGNVSRYFPSGVKSLSVEPDTNKYNTLMLITGGVPYDSAEASGRRTTVANKTFEGMSSRAKFDTIVMNSPNGAEGKTAKEHLKLAVAHLNDSGRIVAVLPETESMDKFVKELIDGNPSLHLSGEVKLPACAYSIGGVSQKAKVVVIDMLKREEMRKKWSDTQTVDLSDTSDINDFFAKLKDVKVPERVLDPAAKDMQHANNVKTALSKIKAFNDGKTGYKSQTAIEVNDKGIFVSPEKKFYNLTYRNNGSYTYVDNYGTKICPYVFEDYIKYEDVKKLSPDILTHYVMYSDMAKMSDADIRRNFFSEYRIKRTDESKMPSYIDAMRQYGEAVAKMIRGISGRSDAQLRRAAKGEDIDNPVSVKAGTKMTIDDYKALFEANNEDGELGALFNRVYDVAKKLGLNIDVFNDENTGTSAYYDNSNSIRINEAHWNTKKIVNSQGKIVTATKGLRAQVLCHELIHSVTSYANYWYDHNPEYLPDNLREAAEELNDVYNKIMHDKESYKIPMYARENKDELVAEMANPEVREPLKKIGMWTRLVNAVKKFFMGDEKKVAVEGGFAEEKDFEQSTVYNELSKTLDKFLNNFDKDSYDAFIRISGTQNESVRNDMELGKTFSDSKEDFDKVRDRAVEENGIVMPNLKKESVKVIPVEKHGFGENKSESIKNARAWAKENIATNDGEMPTMRDGTPYVISKAAIEKYLSNSAISKSEDPFVHLSVLPKLTDVIHESIEAEIHPDYKKGDDGMRSVKNGYGEGVLVHRLYGAVKLDGTTYRVKTTMQEFRGGEENKPHSYEVTKIELLDSPGERENPDRPPLVSSNSSIPAAKLLDGVEKSYDKGKKLLDESKDLTEGEVHFRLGNKNSQPREQSESEKHISKAIEKTAQQTGGKVKQVHSVDQIENEQVRKDIENGKEVTGWYDEKTGEVHLYMPNIHDSYTAAKTIWHETVGHKGMRGLLGDKFHTYLRSLWMDMDSPVFEELHKYVKERMAKEPLSMYDAIEEFIADAAEKGKGEPGFWNNVKNKVVDALHEIGYRLCPNVKDVSAATSTTIKIAITSCFTSDYRQMTN